MDPHLHYGNILKPYQPLSVDDDYWFSEQDLAAFIGTRKPQTEWHKFKKSYPWIWVGGHIRFSAYGLWRLHRGTHDSHVRSFGSERPYGPTTYECLPHEFRDYFERKDEDMKAGQEIEQRM